MSERDFISVDDLMGDTRPLVVSESQIGRDAGLYRRLKNEAKSRGVELHIVNDDDFAVMTNTRKPKLQVDENGVYTDSDGRRHYLVSQQAMNENGHKWYGEQKARAAELNLPIWYSQ